MGRGEATLRSQRIGEPATGLVLDVDETFYGGVLHARPDGELMLAAYHVDIDRDERWMSFARFSPDLEVRQPLTRSDAAYTRGELAFPTPEGWLWWNLDWPDVVLGQRLDQSGQVLESTEPYPFRAANPPLAHVALEGGHHLVALPPNDLDEPLVFARIDERGGLVQQLEVEVPPNPAGAPDYAGQIDLIEHQGAFWATWNGSPPSDGEANHVHVQRYGCIAP